MPLKKSENLLRIRPIGTLAVVDNQCGVGQKIYNVQSLFSLDFMLHIRLFGKSDKSPVKGQQRILLAVRDRHITNNGRQTQIPFC